MQDKKLDEFQEHFNNIMLNNPGAVTGAIGSPYTTDTITLSSLGATYSNTMISGGGHTVPNASITAGTGISYPYLTSTGANPTWANSVIPKIQLNGEGADIEVNGESLMGLLKQISERLNLLKTDEKLEAEWAELRDLGEQYRALEKHIKEKQATWDRLKAIAPPEID